MELRCGSTRHRTRIEIRPLGRRPFGEQTTPIEEHMIGPVGQPSAAGPKERSTMTHDASRDEEPHQSASSRKRKMASGVLLAVVSVLSASLGVTAARATGASNTDGASVPEFGTRVAAAETRNQNKVSNPKKPKGNSQKTVKGTKGPGPDPAVLLNPQPLPPEK
jgi:hypothetical protein